MKKFINLFVFSIVLLSMVTSCSLNDNDFESDEDLLEVFSPDPTDPPVEEEDPDLDPNK